MDLAPGGIPGPRNSNGLAAAAQMQQWCGQEQNRGLSPEDYLECNRLEDQEHSQKTPGVRTRIWTTGTFQVD